MADDDYLESLPALREVISAYNLRAEKALGQNFLLDQNITDKIVRHAGDLSAKTVIEIGPGPGGLTRSLLKSNAQKVIAVEFDLRAVCALQNLQNVAKDRLEILHEDALNLNLLGVCEGPRMIVANLPYNIATPLLMNWLLQIRDDGSAYDGMMLMFQKEVAERIVSKPGQKTYGRLSVICQWVCDVHKIFDLSPAAFTPAPKVKSSVVKFVPKALPENDPGFSDVEALTACAFGQRRKMIRSSLKDYLNVVERLGLDPKNRAENLSVEDFINIARGG